MADYIPHEEELGHGFRLEIVHDDDSGNNPREWDNLGTMVGWSPSRTMGDEQPGRSPALWLYGLATELDIAEWAIAWLYREPHETTDDLANLSDWELEGRIEDAPGRLLANIEERCLILGLNLGYNGDLSICAASYAATCSETGFVYATYADIAKEYGKVTPETIERARKLLQGEVKEYSDWATGNVYGYRLFGPPTLDDEGDEIEEGEELDACWGFVGDYDDHCLPEAKHAARWQINAWLKDKPTIPLPRELSLTIPRQA
ncbi:MAG: hypothetical protein J0I99_00615 [Devosia sp.]|uniref:hypothetical protein n=1 Tax=Devosia sp. TaxID=1871048 RepID=UPI001AC97AE7|nr:hypothetical protein [Devosia sp.]MBN9314219.1 hypothetical protein [Devosia sp.]